MKNILTTSRVATLAICAATGAAGANKILTEVDTGGSLNGTLFLTVNAAASSDAMAIVEVWTSSRSDFASSGSALAAISSDGQARVKIASDTQNINLMFAKGTTNAAISGLTVSSNTITAIDTDGVYALSCPNVSKYLNVQYTSVGTGSVVSATWVGHDIAEGPYTGAQATY